MPWLRASLALVLLSGSLASAHHSFAMFDQTRTLELKGVVKDFQWTNPHAFIHLDVPAKSGVVETWDIELNSPNNLKRQGWRADSLKTGDKVVLVTNPLRDTSKKGGLFVGITLPDGSVLGEPGRHGAVNVPAEQ